MPNNAILVTNERTNAIQTYQAKRRHASSQKCTVSQPRQSGMSRACLPQWQHCGASWGGAGVSAEASRGGDDGHSRASSVSVTAVSTVKLASRPAFGPRAA